MNPIIINQDKCVGCGLCVNDCPNACLSIEGNVAHITGTGCIACGHCYAICPGGAIRMEGYDCAEEPVVSMTELPSDKLLLAMKSRRTIRHFMDVPVEPEKISQILEAGRYSPTGGNAQNVTYTILGSKQAEAEAICVRLFRAAKKLGAPFVGFLKQVEIGDDFFFKGAPLVIVVSSKSDINAGLASAYMELMAESLGLGVLYSGFFAVCAKVSRKLRKLICLPKGNKVVSCMIVGYPVTIYRRIVPRKALQARWL